MKHFCILHKQSGAVANPKIIAAFFNALKDGRHIIEASDYDKRSNQQNRYYFGLVVPLIQNGIKDLGTELTKEETHEFLKSQFNLSEIVNHDTGETVSIPLSTTRLNKEQFGEYIEKIQRFAAEFLSIEIPDPGIQSTIEY
jgi:hypothetical protein